MPLPEGQRIGADYFSAPTTSGDTIDGDACSVEHFEVHIHSHLSIFLDGRQLAVPAAIGIKDPDFITDSRYPDGFVDFGSCIYSLHTHDTSGKLHVESPTRRTYTLGEVFRIWNQPLSRANVAGIASQPIVFYINDGTNLRRFEGDPNSIELASQREITIQIGAPISTIPRYQWTSDRVQSAEHQARTMARRKG